MALYTDAQMKLLKVLLEDEKCTFGQLAELTGAPHGSLSSLAKRAGAKSQNPRKPGKTVLGRINDARKLNYLRNKYAKELNEQFPNKKPAP